VNPDPRLDPTREALTNEVFALTVTADMASSQIPTPGSCRGLCLAATGAGHIPETLIEPLATLQEAGVALVATSRCPEGRLARQTYDFPGSERTLHEELGFLFSDLNLQKTRIKTIVALAAEALDRAFT
jgi:L-asparaginase